MTDGIGDPSTPEGRLLGEAVRASGRSVRAFARESGISDTRWRHIVAGWQSAPGGGRTDAHATAATLARMAFVAGVTEQQLEEAGRADAAVRLAELRAVSDRGTGGPTAFEDLELIFSSSLSAERKLTVIRMVLQLHAEIEGQLPPGGGQDVQP